MIEKVVVSNALGATLQIELGDPTSGLLVEEIGGLGPVKATVVESTSAGVAGAQYQSSHREGRDITFKINLEPDYVVETVWDLRQRVYDFFMTEMKVSLRFYVSSGLYVDIAGVVESCEPEIFTAEPAMNVSIRCSKPDFIDPNTVTMLGNTVSTTATTDIFYPGSVASGIVLTLNVNRALTAFTIYSTPYDNVLRQLDFAGALQAGDTFEISTVTGNKYVSLTRGGITSSLLYAIDPASNWINFFKGVNKFRVYATGAAIPYSLKYVTKYGGL